jgi:hypothetical protein
MKRAALVAVLAGLLVLALAVPALAANPGQKTNDFEIYGWMYHGSFGGDPNSSDPSGFQGTFAFGSTKTTGHGVDKSDYAAAWGVVWNWDAGLNAQWEVPLGQVVDGTVLALSADQFVTSGKSLTQAKTKVLPATFTNYLPDPYNPVVCSGTAKFEFRGIGEKFKDSFGASRMATAIVTIDCPGLGIHQVITSDADTDFFVLSNTSS